MRQRKIRRNMEAVLDALLLLFAQNPAERARRVDEHQSLLGSSLGVGVLDSTDSMNRGILFCGHAVLVLLSVPDRRECPGRPAATGLARHLALNQQAAADVGSLFTSSAATSSAVTGTA